MPICLLLPTGSHVQSFQDNENQAWLPGDCNSPLRCAGLFGALRREGKGGNTKFSVTYLLHFYLGKIMKRKILKQHEKVGRKERRRKKGKGKFLYSYHAEKNTPNSQKISWLVSLINIYIFKTKIGVNFDTLLSYFYC